MYSPISNGVHIWRTLYVRTVDVVPGHTSKRQETVGRLGTRTRRINIRASVEQESLIREAAERRGENLTDFMLRSACIEAELTLTDRHNFALSPERWKAFLEALDKAPVVKPQLQRLFSEPSILEKNR